MKSHKDWDVSSVETTQAMFYVRAPPSRVAAALASPVSSSSSPIPYPLAPRSPLTPHGRPSLAAL
ncbi:MAG: hypothetical protein ABGY24_01820 [bacterium]